MSAIIPKTSGIYKITCTANDKIYVGSTNNFYVRWTGHKKSLRKGNHYSPYLQRSWNKYGESAFTFEIIELVMPWSILDREQYWLDTLQPFGQRGFNTNRLANGGGQFKGQKLSSEHRTKISESHKGIKPNEDARKKMSEAKKGKPRNPHSAETKEKMRQAAILRSTPEYREQISKTLKNHPRYSKE